MNQKVKSVLDHILTAFKSGDIPKSVATATFPIPDIPSARWSFSNRVIQAISGTEDARGFKQWLAVHRKVKKGSKAIYILAPCFKKEIDDTTGEEIQVIRYFKTVPVFRFEDTEGEPLGEFNIELPELPLMDRAKEWGISVKAVPGHYPYYGCYISEKKEIALASPSEVVFFHELAHAADDLLKGKLEPEQNPLQEITAELVAQALAYIVGKSSEDTMGNCYRYIRNYADQLNISPHKACLTVLSDSKRILDIILNGKEGDDNDQQTFTD